MKLLDTFALRIIITQDGAATEVSLVYEESDLVGQGVGLDLRATDNLAEGLGPGLDLGQELGVEHSPILDLVQGNGL